MRAPCQPASGVHSTVNMWSVKYCPKPGFARISARRPSGTATLEGVMLISMGDNLVGLPGKWTRDGRAHPVRPAVSDGGGASAGYSGGDRVADLGGTPTAGRA